jgi:hypothetical protein
MRMQVIQLLDRFVLPTKKALCAGALLLLATVTACGEGDVDPSLEITRFEKAACRDSAPAGGDENCFRLTVVVNGSTSGGVGSCQVVAVDDRGADISVGANSARNNLKGYGGDDRLRGRGGDDRLFGGEGVDAVRGGHGEDRVTTPRRFTGVKSSSDRLPRRRDEDDMSSWIHIEVAVSCG